jgi:hypothetical protein
MGATGSALDNAACESFFGPLKKELIRQRCWPGGASRGARSSSGSRPGTTRAGCTRRSGTSHRTTTAIALGPGGDGEGSCLARRSPPKRGGPSCSARFLCHASACESSAPRHLEQRRSQALLPARRPHAQAVVCQAPCAAAGRQGRRMSAGFIRTRYATPTPLNGSRGHTHERLARSARPSLPGDYGPIPTGRGPCPGHRDDEAQGVELGLVGSTQRCAAHLVRRLHMRLHGIEVADRGVGVILVGLQGLHHGRAR